MYSEGMHFCDMAMTDIDRDYDLDSFDDDSDNFWTDYNHDSEDSEDSEDID
jgi:hypothetical protein